MRGIDKSKPPKTPKDTHSTQASWNWPSKASPPLAYNSLRKRNITTTSSCTVRMEVSGIIHTRTVYHCLLEGGAQTDVFQGSSDRLSVVVCLTNLFRVTSYGSAKFEELVPKHHALIQSKECGKLNQHRRVVSPPCPGAVDYLHCCVRSVLHHCLDLVAGDARLRVDILCPHLEFVCILAYARLTHRILVNMLFAHRML